RQGVIRRATRNPGSGRQHWTVHVGREGVCRPACLEGQSENRGLPADEWTSAWAWLVEPFLSSLLAVQEPGDLSCDRAVVCVHGDKRFAEGGSGGDRTGSMDSELRS